MENRGPKLSAWATTGGEEKGKADGSARGWGCFPPALEQKPRGVLRQLFVLFSSNMDQHSFGSVRSRPRNRIPIRPDAFHLLAGDMSIHHCVSKTRRRCPPFYSRRFARPHEVALYICRCGADGPATAGCSDPFLRSDGGLWRLYRGFGARTPGERRVGNKVAPRTVLRSNGRLNRAKVPPKWPFQDASGGSLQT
jgi:hypothetical protein